MMVGVDELLGKYVFLCAPHTTPHQVRPPTWNFGRAELRVRTVDPSHLFLL